ncbi:MAG TPA: hypothetical protein PK573_11680 [Spirochaetota bacterium]|nr:hypothetical protein [Spirochaetota bacterium]HRZ25760.1 hypothetical protein [Spirochaetota bacterium]HSA13219.1 hypothetical protein [Spirochaetota bacterium]
MNKKFEQSIDDLVYEDEYYKDSYADGKAVVVEEESEETACEDDDFAAIIVCEDCGHQWEDLISEEGSDEPFCPMCGSSRVTQV